MWLYGPMEVKLIKAIPFHRSGIDLYCKIQLCHVRLVTNTGNTVSCSSTITDKLYRNQLTKCFVPKVTNSNTYIKPT